MGYDLFQTELTLRMLNSFKDYERCFHIFHHILGFVQQKTKFTMEQPYMLSILYCQYHACWCLGDLRSQGISRHGINQIIWNIPSLVSEELTHWGWDKMAATWADDIFKCNFINENVWVSIKIPLNFVPEGPINNKFSLVQVMAWRRTGNKPLHEPMMTQFNDAYICHYVCTSMADSKCFRSLFQTSLSSLPSHHLQTWSRRRLPLQISNQNWPWYNAGNYAEGTLSALLKD